jgi:hypothetical protein
MRNAYTANDNIVYTMLITRSARISLHLLVAKLSFWSATKLLLHHPCGASDIITTGHRGAKCIDGSKYEFHILRSSRSLHPLEPSRGFRVTHYHAWIGSVLPSLSNTASFNKVTMVTY